ncbi:MAG: hypothetical protein M0Z95_09040 [Actinomycetota bacterium]|nr:hypothetical protein [Actinomycetota bacterium]
MSESTPRPVASEISGRPLPAPPGWPDPPDRPAWTGLAGAIAETLAPSTEADPVAILAQLLIGAGVVIGRGAWVAVEATRHHPNEFVLLVGDSAKARKGSSWDHVEAVLARADPTFVARTRTGLSTGEGLIWAARDAHGSDPGNPDPRLLVIEPEFVSVLKATGRDINTLSPVLRGAWDARPLATLTRTAPLAATRAHIAVIGHITRAELAAHTTAVEAANGFLNRFCFFAVRRHRLLPDGAEADPLAVTDLAGRLGANLAVARRAGRVSMEHAARAEWHDIYAQLSEPTDGLVGSLTARAEAHVLRLAMLDALVDGDSVIRPTHLRGALAIWDYAARSVAWATRNTTADPVAEQIHAALATAPDGLTRTQLRDLFARNLPAKSVDRALIALGTAGRAERRRVATAGRPAEVWSAATNP